MASGPGNSKTARIKKLEAKKQNLTYKAGKALSIATYWFSVSSSITTKVIQLEEFKESLKTSKNKWTTLKGNCEIILNSMRKKFEPNSPVILETQAKLDQAIQMIDELDQRINNALNKLNALSDDIAKANKWEDIWHSRSDEMTDQISQIDAEIQNIRNEP